ncbi:MAG: hypothetical protein JWN20_647, partial [Jatrophihabitantaceae bacterium]|nr:hypothetical protein [Jatrophihabitantaceae bacterium]
AVAVGAGATVGRGTGNPSRDVALVDATPSATTAPPLAPTTARTTTPAVVPAAATTPAAASSASSAPPAAAATGLAAGGIPVVALQAYQGAAAAMRTANSACGINWPLIASIGRIESNHGRTSGALLVDGTSNPPVMGILLTGGNGFAGIKDTDGGVLDGNAQYDRAIGPMQFIPSTWKMYASDGNGDGKSDPFNIYDAALAAAKYLCKAGGDLRTGAGIQRAVYSYNHDTSYVNRVLALADEYAVAFNENRLPITAVTDAPAPSDSDLPPATVGGGAQTPTATPTPTPSAPSRPSDSAAPSDSATPTASATASATPTLSSTPSTPPSPSESTTSAAPTASVTSTSPSSSASETPAPTTSASTSPSETSATISTSAAAVSAAPSAS